MVNMISSKVVNLYSFNTAAKISLCSGTYRTRNSFPYSLKPNMKIPAKASFNQVSQFHFSTGSESKNYDVKEERKIIEKWLEMCKYEGQYVPEKISEEHFQKLMETENIREREKYLSYLSKREAAVKNTKIRLEKQKKLKEIRKEESLKQNLGHIYYGLWRNTMFGKTHNKNLLNFYSHRLASAMVHGQPLVFDLGFDDHMRGREVNSLCTQVIMCIAMNRINLQPFNLTLCNVEFESETVKNLKKRMPYFANKDFPMNVSSKSYLEMYPRDKLVYLTSNARDEMTTIDPDAIYIIGGIVDLGGQKPVTFAKAKREGIKMQKLPFDRYLLFKSRKDLGLHVMMAILLDFQETGDWKKAFENIPRRHLFSEGQGDDRWNKSRFKNIK